MTDADAPHNNVASISHTIFCAVAIKASATADAAIIETISRRRSRMSPRGTKISWLRPAPAIPSIATVPVLAMLRWNSRAKSGSSG